MVIRRTARKVRGTFNLGPLTHIFIQGLFGFATYNIPLRNTHSADLDAASILYGDNGSGKTTILKLVFNLLSTREGRGEKTYIAKTPFKLLKVEFANGATITAKKTDGLTGSYHVELDVPSSGTASFLLLADSDGDVMNDEQATAYFRVLETLEMQLLFLTDNRRILATSDYFDDENLARFSERNFKVHSVASEIARREGHPFDVELIVGRFRNAIREGLLRGSRDGESNANSTYIDLLEQVAIPHGNSTIRELPIPLLVQRVSDLAARGKDFSEFGIAESISESRIHNLLTRAHKDKLGLLQAVLIPYLDGIEARLNALEPVQSLVRNFVHVTQNFFGDKKQISFSVQKGLSVLDRVGNPVPVTLLSSGERHLLMLLCATVIARERATLFLIDEPELSLNIKWQRMLIDALQICAAGSKIQFIVASHSLELLTKYSNQTIKLEDIDA